MGNTSFQPSVFRDLDSEVGEIEAFVFELPMRVKFRGITVRDGVLLRGRAGWAEFSPFWGYGIEYSARWLLGAVDAALRGVPSGQRRIIPVNATVPAVSAQIAAQIAARSGALTAKVKVAEPGQTPADDLNRLTAVRQALGSKGKIRIDVNGKWDLTTALTLLPRYHRAAGGLEYVEQPCTDVADLARVRRECGEIQIAADESIRRAENPFQVREMEAADLIVVKNQPLGGVRGALELVEAMELPAVVSSALESSIGLAGGVSLASALPDLPYACGLGTAYLFDGDVCAHPLFASEGQIQLADSVQVQPDLILKAYQLGCEENLAEEGAQLGQLGQPGPLGQLGQPGQLGQSPCGDKPNLGTPVDSRAPCDLRNRADFRAQRGTWEHEESRIHEDSRTHKDSLTCTETAQQITFGEQRIAYAQAVSGEGDILGRGRVVDTKDTFLAAPTVAHRQQMTPLPCAHTWQKWSHRLADVWNYCQRQGWIGRDLIVRQVELPQAISAPSEDISDDNF